MKHESIRKLVLIIVFVFVVLAFISMGKESQDENLVVMYPITQVASVASVVSPKVDNENLIIPGCISSVQNALNTDACVVNDCNGGVHVGLGLLNQSDVFACVSEEYWDGFEGSYDAEEWGCLANRCLNHTTAYSVGVMTEETKKSPDNVSLKNIENPVTSAVTIPDCIESVSNAPTPLQTCRVQDCDFGIISGNGPLSQGQFDQCLSGNPLGNATYEQLGCLADECLNFTESPKPVNYDSIYPNYDFLTIGSNDPIIFTVEYELKQKGLFNLLKPDTVFGYRTLESVKVFQASVGLKSTGKLDSETLAKLFVK